MNKQINHSNIIRLFDEFRKNDSWYMVFEYCGRGDLEKLIGKKGTFHQNNIGMLKEELVSLIAAELVEAVFYLQEKNIAHRDIKLANILITDGFEVKLADLGFAKAVHHDEDFLKSYAGTPVIMAPEIFDNGKYTNKCDIWSLGVVLYQLLYGHLPFYPKKGVLEDLISLVKNAPV
jgi:serine/threonine protein kinase